jgi:hypothetical protein
MNVSNIIRNNPLCVYFIWMIIMFNHFQVAMLKLIDWNKYIIIIIIIVVVKK